MTTQPDAQTAPDINKEIKEVRASPTPNGLRILCTKLFLEHKGEEAFRLILDVVSSHMDDTPIIAMATALLWEYTARHDVVVLLMRHVVRREPYNLPAKLSLANALITTGAEHEGYGLFAELITQNPSRRADLCEHLSKVLLDTGRLDEALRILEFWSTTGEETYSLVNNMACALQNVSRSRDALPWFHKAIEMATDKKRPSFGLAVAQLKAGDFKAGWHNYAQRDPVVDNKNWWFVTLPRLRHGDTLHGKRVILYQEQGFGDTLQFVRSTTWLIEAGANVTLAVPRPLLRLLTRSFPRATVKEIRSFGEHKEEGYDYSAPIPDLPYIVGVVSDETIPATIPYFQADPADVEKFGAMLPPSRPRVGLVWAGAQRIKAEFVLTDRRRSSNLQDMASALTPVDATLVNLQFGPPHQQILAWEGQPIADPMRQVNDMADTAAIMENLDLIISVDTSPLHLSGGPGPPPRGVRPRVSGGRRGGEGGTTPRDTGLRVFRAKELSFAPTWKEVGAALHQWVANWKAPCPQPDA
ncbi:MAG: glycosyltransferase [Acetobacter papayae]|uniref:tetratricopeptide repeat protein n=1 Tax=Acetobacter papayae TaxID=1076592 RepID=UPI0039E898F6